MVRELKPSRWVNFAQKVRLFVKPITHYGKLRPGWNVHVYYGDPITQEAEVYEHFQEGDLVNIQPCVGDHVLVFVSIRQVERELTVKFTP